MNKLIKLALHPQKGAKYFLKYAGIKNREIVYLLHKVCNTDLHQSRLDSALQNTNTKNASQLYEKWKKESGRAFFHSNGDEIIETIKANALLSDRIISHADKILDNHFYVLYTFASDRQDANGHYLWLNDYKCNYNYNLVFYANSRKKNHYSGVDYKRVWEIARMQYLLPLALAYRLTNNEKYAQKVKSILNDFSLSNPLYVGPNWNPSMEIGIRAANIVLSIELIQSSTSIDMPFIQEMIGLLSDHVKAILENEENTSGKTSNHYLGGLLGLAAVSSYVPYLNKSPQISNYVFNAINDEINKQIFESGGDYEGSTSYHRLVGELIGFTMIACQNNHHVFSRESLKKVYGIAEFTYNIAGDNCDVFQIGDNDSGRVFQLLPEDPNNHSFMINLVTAITKNCIRYPNGKEFLAIFTGKILPTVPFQKRAQEWIARDFGIGRISSETMDLVISCINVQKNGMGGHTHNDCGSFCLRCNGLPVIVDPGTGVYTGDPDTRNTLRSIDSHSSIRINQSEPRAITNNLFNWNDNYGSVDFRIENQTAFILIRKKGTVINRNITVKEHSVAISDSVSQEDFRSVSMKLVLAPGSSTKLYNKNKCLILGSFGSVLIHGSWDITETENLFSLHYDSITKTKALFLTSNRKENTLSIDQIELSPEQKLK